MYRSSVSIRIKKSKAGLAPFKGLTVVSSTPGVQGNDQMNGMGPGASSRGKKSLWGKVTGVKESVGLTTGLPWKVTEDWVRTTPGCLEKYI